MSTSEFSVTAVQGQEARVKINILFIRLLYANYLSFILFKKIDY